MLAPANLTASRPGTWLRLLLIVTLLAAFWLRLQELTRQDIWWDEARNIDVALRPFLQVATAPELDIQPPIYYWLLHAWDGLLGLALGQSPQLLAFGSRLLSVFAGVAGIALLYPLGRRAGGGPAGAAAALLGAFSPFWLAESQEARMYTVGFALLAGAGSAFLTAFARACASPAGSATGGAQGTPARLDRWWLVLFVLLSAAALLTHYNALFVLMAWYAWWSVWALLQPDRWRQLGTALVCSVAMALLVLPVAPIALRQIPGYENPNITVPTPAEYLWQNGQAYVGGYAFGPQILAGSGLLWLWTVLAICAVGLTLAILPGPQPSGAHPHTSHFTLHTSPFSLLSLSFLSTWLIAGLALYYIAVLDRNAFNVRYASFVTPALYALMGVGLAAFARWSRLLPLVALAVVIAGLWPAAQADLYDNRFDREDISGVTQWLAANTRPGDLILVDQKYPFGFYYQPYAIDTGSELAATDRPPARYLFVDINTVDRRLNEWARDARRVFWVQWFESDTDPRRAVHFLLDQAGQRAGEQWFQGYSVDWWDLEPPTTFALAPDLAPASHRFPAAVETVAVSLPQATLARGDPLPVAIRWKRAPGDTLDRPLKARVALYAAGDARLVQADERLLNDRHRAPAQWAMDDQPLNVYLLPLPSDLPPGAYTVRLLVYDADTLEPLEVGDAAGNPAGQEATLGEVQVAASIP